MLVASSCDFRCSWASGWLHALSPEHEAGVLVSSGHIHTYDLSTSQERVVLAAVGAGAPSGWQAEPDLTWSLATRRRTWEFSSLLGA